jgi:alanyl-tRNA synthetase
MVAQNKPTVFETDLFMPLINSLSSIFGDRQKRIIADHGRAVAFLITDGVRPSNKEQGYVLRRLMRRMIAQQAFREEGLMAVGSGNRTDLSKILEKIIELYSIFYPNLLENKKNIISIFDDESVKYGQAIKRGIKEVARTDSINASQAFYLFESFGLPYEVIKDIAGDKAKNLTREEFDDKFKKHQEISRAGAEKKFGGHGLSLDAGGSKTEGENKEKIVRLHTATHLLQAALRQILGDKVSQRGSDINPERLRFDFSFDRKITSEEIKKIEDLVNEKIKENLPVNYTELPLEKALASGALHFFNEKYPEKVKIYFTGDDLGSAFSKEFCGGPHIKNTSEIGKFKILKEESASAGIRRIRASVSDN